jgi:hypothetical protein
MRLDVGTPSVQPNSRLSPYFLREFFRRLFPITKVTRKWFYRVDMELEHIISYHIVSHHFARSQPPRPRRPQAALREEENTTVPREGQGLRALDHGYSFRPAFGSHDVDRPPPSFQTLSQDR